MCHKSPRQNPSTPWENNAKHAFAGCQKIILHSFPKTLYNLGKMKVPAPVKLPIVKDKAPPRLPKPWTLFFLLATAQVVAVSTVVEHSKEFPLPRHRVAKARGQ